MLDLAKWDAALYTDKLLPKAVLAEMWTPVKLNNGKTSPYGYGWQTGELRGHPWVGHGGGIHGFSSFILRFLQDKLTVIVLVNRGTNSQAIAASVAAETTSAPMRFRGVMCVVSLSQASRPIGIRLSAGNASLMRAASARHVPRR